MPEWAKVVGIVALLPFVFWAFLWFLYTAIDDDPSRHQPTDEET